MVGHSIGAYIALQGAMKCASSPRDEVACAVGLMPYLDNTGIEENYALRSKVRLAGATFAACTTALSTRVRACLANSSGVGCKRAC